MSIVLRNVEPSLVGGWVLPHEGTIKQKHIRHVGEQGYCIVSSSSSFIRAGQLFQPHRRTSGAVFEPDRGLRDIGTYFISMSR